MPQIYVSKALIRSVSAQHLKAIIAHEQAHVRRRDCLRIYLAQTCSLLFWPSIRRAILEDLFLATEQACDEEAAAATGDHLQVAETIVAVERLLLGSPMAFAEVNFVNNNSTQRIQSLLAEGQFDKPLFPAWIIFLPAPLKAAVLMPGATHSLVHLIRW